MNRRWLWLLLAFPLLTGLARLRFDADVLNLLPTEVPAVRGLQWHQRYFATSQTLLLTLRGAEPEAVATAAQELAHTLARASNLVQSVRWQPPGLERPADAVENLAWLWQQRPPAELAQLAARLHDEPLRQQLNETRATLAHSFAPQELARASYDPLGLTELTTALPGAGFDPGQGVFVGDEGHFRVLHLEPANPAMNYREAAGWLEAVRHQVARTVGGTALQVAYTGGPAFLAEIANGMEADLRNSVLTTLAVIAGLFWLAHRSLRPLLCLLGALAVTLAGTLALGGLCFGTLNVVSAGFAAVLLGLAVDYGLVGYQEARAQPGDSLPQLRRRIARGVGWSAATTAGTFFLLRFAGLPGLAQLGALTAMGLLLGAVVMLYGFLPLALGSRKSAAARPASVVPLAHPAPVPTLWPTGVVVVIALGVLAVRGLPPATASAEPLRPRNSPAYAAMGSLQRGLGQTNDTIWLLFRAPTPAAVAQQLRATENQLRAAQTEGRVSAFTLPNLFWPQPTNAAANRALIRELGARAESIRQTALAAGFTADSLALAAGVFAAWQRESAAASDSPQWPTNATARWLTAQFSARTPNGDWLALGAVTPSPSGVGLGPLPAGVIATSWERLGQELLARIAHRVGWLTALLTAGLVGSLWFAFRRWSEVWLSLAGLALSFLLLLAAMAAFGASWNLLNLVAIPVLLGSSVDSTIHVQLALRRTGGDSAALWRSIGRALLLCAGANVAGFGSLAGSNNAGLASLDLVCAGGVVAVFGVTMGLLPAWWRRAGHRSELAETEAEADPGPSNLYRAGPWRLASRLARGLPRGLCRQLARGGVWLYAGLRPERLAVVVDNLRPFAGPDPAAARRLARANFREFADKLADLWRFEAGADVGALITPGTGWEHLTRATQTGRGVLLVTPHLGNWEFGAVLLQRQGISPLVLTAPEPGGTFTTERAGARARHGIETLVVGADPFAFVQAIRRLQDGGVVALLVDRPPVATRVPTEFCGRPFHVSIAAAELARATGCVVLPVFVIRAANGYQAHALPPLAYDRRELGSRGKRAEFAGQILRVFEPAVRQFAAQWFHFVPIWAPPTESKTEPPGGQETKVEA
jgi:predicted exporter/lauroyl/myristoyl acyltransferase